jgi:predicted  nucleic acid-binding Zn-ribbon protein
MNDVFEKLRSLQDILHTKFEIENEINDIPKILETKTEVLNRAKKTFIEKNERSEKLKEKIRKLQIQMEDATHSREEYEKQMDLIKTQKEYEALDKEIKDASEKEQSLRREIQKEQKELEEIGEELEKRTRQISMDEEELEELKTKIESESAAKKKEWQSLRNQEEKISPGLDEEVLFKFERIIKSKAGTGIVAIKNGVCSGCHMILPKQFVNEVREEKDINFCPYCSRILYFQSHMDSDMALAPKNMDTDAGSLSDLFEGDGLLDDEE